jgi:plasmid stability protein
MAELRIRNVEPWIVENLRTLARDHGHSMEEEIKDLLRDKAIERKQKMVAEMQTLIDDMRAKYGELSDSAVLIREDRDERG